MDTFLTLSNIYTIGKYLIIINWHYATALPLKMARLGLGGR